ncbi:MAG TPA: hypothetical protein VEJ63_22620 [Planctomycetota bacterium]|nr:hypothetical protein [Planctomycetota bacterium]
MRAILSLLVLSAPLLSAEEVPLAGGTNLPDAGATVAQDQSWKVYKAEASTITDGRDSKVHADRIQEWERKNPDREQKLFDLRRRIGAYRDCNTF